MRIEELISYASILTSFSEINEKKKNGIGKYLNSASILTSFSEIIKMSDKTRIEKYVYTSILTSFSEMDGSELKDGKRKNGNFHTN